MEGNLLPVVPSLFRRSFFTGHMSREPLRISQSTARPQLVAGDLSGCSHRLAATARGDETYERGRNSRKDGYQSRGRFAIRERTLSVERVTSRQSYVSWESWPRRGYAAPRQGRDLEAATVDNARHLQALLEKEEVRGTVARSGEGRETKEGVRKEYREERATSFRCGSTLHGKTLIQQRDTNQTAVNRGTFSTLLQSADNDALLLVNRITLICSPEHNLRSTGLVTVLPITADRMTHCYQRSSQLLTKRAKLLWSRTRLRVRGNNTSARTLYLTPPKGCALLVDARLRLDRSVEESQKPREPGSVRLCDPASNRLRGTFVRWKINYTADGPLPEGIFDSLRSKAEQGGGQKKSSDRKSKNERDEEGRWNEFSCRNITRPIISYETKHINSEHLQTGSQDEQIITGTVSMVVFPTSKLNIPLVYDFFVVVEGRRVSPLLFVPATNKMCLLPNCTLKQQQSSSNDGGKRSIGRLVQLVS
ncbi:hypothetical protein WN51_09359 [Melipona quadrifasciata]|uniref:Uncharacterized protein n=1 Tax=Melipona quadrifasciata TaxID=166423 RepID=A0A0N1ITW2_9HYME|nr:hypothetical protein WN51_09359 [Melipona quadrifasciata]